MICIVCLRSMTPYHEYMKSIANPRMNIPVLAGFKCEHCRDMLSKQFDGSASLKEINEYREWQDKYDLATEKYSDYLPENYSFP